MNNLSPIEEIRELNEILKIHPKERLQAWIILQDQIYAAISRYVHEIQTTAGENKIMRPKKKAKKLT